MSYAPIHEKTWQDTEREIFTPAEREECRMQAEIMKELVKRRRKMGISQRKLGEMTGVTRSAIARLETGQTSPTLETMMKILVPLGKTLIMADYTPEVTPTKTQTPPVLERSR